MSHPNHLQELPFAAPRGRAAAVLTDAGIQVRDQSWREPLMIMADALAALAFTRLPDQVSRGAAQ